MSNANPRYLRAWPNEQYNATGTVTSVGSGSGLLGGPITAAGTLSIDYGTPADLIAGTDNVKLFHAAALSGASVAGLSAGAGDAGKIVRLDASGALSPSVMGSNAIALTAGVADAGKLVKTDATGKIDPSFLPAAGGSGTVTNIATGAGLTGGPITTTGTVSLAPSGVTAGTSGSGTAVPVVTVDTYGRITSITTQTVTPAWASVTGKPTTLAGYGITDAVPNTASVSGTTSLTGGGALSGAPLTISLVGDVAAPGNGYYYGTDATGVKGYHVLPAGGGGGGGGSGTVTSIATGTGLQGGPISTSGTISLTNTGVTAGTYQGITLDAQGRATAAVDKRYVVGPASATDHAITRWDTASGLLVQDSNVIVSDTGLITTPDDIAVNGGNITTTALTADVFNVTAKTVNIGGAATKVEIGAATGTTSVNNNLKVDGNTTLGLAAADTITSNASTMAIPNNLNIDGNTLMIDAANDRVGFGTATPLASVDVNGTAVSNLVTVAGSTLDLALGQVFSKTVAGALTWDFANVPAGRATTVVLHLRNGGSAAQTWPAEVKWPSGVAPTLTNPGTDVLVFHTPNGGTAWRANIFGKDIK